MSNSETQSPRRTRLRTKQNVEPDSDTVVTPTKSTVMATAITPRRSTRKSCKPIFDYNEIINLGSPSRKRAAEEEHWNPAVVGRTSEKRGRKRIHGIKQRKGDASTDDDENDMANISLSIFSPNARSEELEEEMTKEIVEIGKKECETAPQVNEKVVKNDEIIHKNEENKIEEIAVENNNNIKESFVVVASEEKDEIIIENEEDLIEEIAAENNNNIKESIVVVASGEKDKIIIENEEDLIEEITAENNNNIKESIVVVASGEKDEINNENEEKNIEEIPLENNNKESIIVVSGEKANENQENVIEEIAADSPIILENNNNNQIKESIVVVALGETPEITHENEKNFIEEIPSNNNNNKVSIIDQSELDFLELGLAPLKDDDQDIENENEKAADEEMESLILCEDEEISAAPNALNATFDTSDCIIISPTAELQNDDQNTLTVPQIIVTSPCTVNKLIEEKEKQQKTSKTPRIQTPYKPKKQQEDREDIEEILNQENTAEILNTTFDEKIPQGIRKRSASTSTDMRSMRKAQKSTNRVTFYSPANQTNYINDSEEEEMAEENMKENLEKVEEPSFITKRRRRSMSFDETVMRKPAIKKPLTPMKATGSRIKLPNFAAIHKKNFEQMENIVEHVARKAERAKVLTSATKKPPGSTGKTQTPGRFGRLSTFEKEKTKATRKIDLGNNSRIPVIIPTPATTMTPQTRFKKAASAEPQPYKNLHKIKSKAISKKPLAKTTMSKSAVDITVAAIKAMENTTTTTTTFTFKSMLQRDGESAASAAEKIAERRKRNMNMFKTRLEEDPDMKVQKKRDEIRGVRLNRRHLLHMEHRRNMNK